MLIFKLITELQINALHMFVGSAMILWDLVPSIAHSLYSQNIVLMPCCCCLYPLVEFNNAKGERVENLESRRHSNSSTRVT